MTRIAPALALVLVIAHQIAYGSADAAQWTFGVGLVVYAAVGGLTASTTSTSSSTARSSTASSPPCSARSTSAWCC
jgi:hypothetical protein